MTSTAATPPARLDVTAVRGDFPVLRRRIHGQPLVYLDNAATTQKPQAVIDRLVRYYSEEHANVERGAHTLGAEATAACAAARDEVRRFLNAADAGEIVFVRGATEAINLVAATYGRSRVVAGDEIVISEMEHHANIVPWQLLCAERGARLRVIPINEQGTLQLDACERLLGPRTRLVAVTHVANALGTINPVEAIVGMAHARGIPVLVDGAQAVAHMPVDVQALGCDFYAFSGHKVFGPTGIGVLYGRAALLDTLPPYQGGGGMIASVTFERTTYREAPSRFEAGTPHVAGIVGLAAALEYVTRIGLDRIAAHERELLGYASEALARIEGLRPIGTAAHRAAILSFTIDGVHPHDLATVADRHGVAIRAGHHCCQPLMARLGVAATARASLAAYTTRDEIDALVRALAAAREVFA